MYVIEDKKGRFYAPWTRSCFRGQAGTRKAGEVMEKYDEAAREFYPRSDELECRILSNDAVRKIISFALQKYDERREKETCECTADKVKGKGYSHCHYCGKLIPGGRPGVLVDGKIVEKEREK